MIARNDVKIKMLYPTNLKIRQTLCWGSGWCRNKQCSRRGPGDCMRPDRRTWPECHLGVGRDPQAAHLDVVVRNVPHREEGVAAGIDGGIAPVLGPGVDAQQGHGTPGGFCTVGLHGRSMVGLFKIVGAAGAGGETDDVADLILKGAYIGDDTFVLGGRALRREPRPARRCCRTRTGPASGRGKGRGTAFSWGNLQREKIQVKNRRFLGCCQEKDICRLYPRGRLC